MTDSHCLALVRAIHTAIYVVMATATLMVFWAGVSGARGPWLYPALGLSLAEAAVFSASGLKCPLTAVVVRYGGEDISDTWFPRSLTRHTFTVFAPLLVIGLVGLLARWIAS